MLSFELDLGVDFDLILVQFWFKFKVEFLEK